MAIDPNDDFIATTEDEQIEDSPYIQYDIATYPSDFTLQGIVEMWRAQDITIPDFQREFVWNIRQSSLLIDSFLAGLPVPPVFFYIDNENKNLVIDGQQRILSVAFYFEGYFGPDTQQSKRQVFRLQGLDPGSPFTNKRFDELDDTNQRKLKGAVLRAINVRQLGPVDDRNTSIYHIFERLNTGGTPLKPQEIRNCVFRGPIVLMLRQLNRDKNWRLIMGRPDIDKHQKDVELLLRVFSLSGGGVKEYEKPMKEFLNISMKRNRAASSKRITAFAEAFPKATAVLVDRLGNRPFHVRGPMNTSVLDSVMCWVIDNIDAIPSNLGERYEGLLIDQLFIEYTRLGTSDKSVLHQRFAIVNKYLAE